jgi:release factor glutamine methyltransferase
VSAAADLLRRAGVPPDEASLDARLLAQQVLGWNALRYLADARKADSPQFAARFDALVERRARREPLAYITGEREFWGLPFEVTPAVLVPRPETEVIVEAALKRFADPDAELTIADVCTGSGCLAVALAHERPRARVVATDVSAAALEVAARNASRHGVADRIRFVNGDLLEGIGTTFDLIVANPPYVPESDRGTLAPEVKDFEPPLALFAGADGLDVIRRLLAQAAQRLSPRGALLFEFGFGQSDRVRELVENQPTLALERIEKDLQSIDRIAIVNLKSASI